MAYNEQTTRSIVTRLRMLESKLGVLANKIQFEINKGGVSAEVIAVVDAQIKSRNTAQQLEFLVNGIASSENGLKTGEVPEGSIEIVKQRLERDKISAEKKTKTAQRIANEAELVYNKYRTFKGRPEAEDEEGKEKKKVKENPKEKQPEKNKTESKPGETTKPSPKKTPSKQPQTKITTPAEKFNNITKEADLAVKKLNESIPAIQKATYEELMLKLKSLDLAGDKIKTTVANLKIIQSIKNNLLRLILSDEYLNDVKAFVKSFNEITKLQSEYWKSIETKFKPKPLLREIRLATISDTVQKLTDAGIGANIAEPISDILRTNITTGGSYRALTAQLRENLVNTQTPGTLEKYIGQITTDSVNQYSNQYTQIVSSDLGYTWFKYDNTDILTTRPFCDALTDRPYFHISEVPALLRAEGLTYLNKKTGKREPVPIYEKTGLPNGMIPGTDASNFFVRRGGYRCQHSIRPVNERQVPQADKDRVFATAAYKAWKSANS